MSETFVSFLNNIGVGKIGLIIVFSIYIIIQGVKFIRNTVIPFWKKKKTAIENEVIEDFNEEEEKCKTQKDIRSIKDDIEKLRELLLEVQESMNTELQKVSATNDIIKGTTETHSKEINSMKDQMTDTTYKIELLLVSDKEDIKGEITNEYYKWTGDEYGYIPIHALKALEDRYVLYLKEHGDTFVAHLMEELRRLPNKRKNTK